MALPYAIANTVFGGMEYGFFWYVTALIGASLIVYLRMRDTRQHSLIQED